MDATEYLRREHEYLRGLFQALRDTPPERRHKRQELCAKISDELIMHELVEEEVFYPALAHARGLVRHAVSDHQHTRELLALLQSIEPVCDSFAEQFELLRSTTEAHMAEEERVIFAAARELGPKELARIGRTLEERKRELTESPVERADRRFKRTAWKVA
jgi:iron-sulfur cluster repair protein YtfE (RIC family)